MVMVIMLEEEKGVKEEDEERPKKNSTKNSIEKRTQDLIERNSPSIHPSFLQLEQSKAKQSHVVSIKINNQAKSTTFYFSSSFPFLRFLSLAFPIPIPIPSYPVRG